MKHTQFNPDNKELLTLGETLDPAMNITDQEDADQYLKAYVKHIENALEKEPHLETGKTAEEIAKENLAYWAGYYSNETRARVEKLFKCKHPIFGSIEENGAPTAEEAFKKGLELGEKHKNSNL